MVGSDQTDAALCGEWRRDSPCSLARAPPRPLCVLPPAPPRPILDSARRWPQPDTDAREPRWQLPTATTPFTPLRCSSTNSAMKTFRCGEPSVKVWGTPGTGMFAECGRGGSGFSGSGGRRRRPIRSQVSSSPVAGSDELAPLIGSCPRRRASLEGPF